MLDWPRDGVLLLAFLQAERQHARGTCPHGPRIKQHTGRYDAHAEEAFPLPFLVPPLIEHVQRKLGLKGSVSQTKGGSNFFVTESGFETCFGWDPRHQRGWDLIAKHISNSDVAPF